MLYPGSDGNIQIVDLGESVKQMRKIGKQKTKKKKKTKERIGEEGRKRGRGEDGTNTVIQRGPGPRLLVCATQ